MRCDWRNDPTCPRARVINLDTGQQIFPCAMADEETGEYERYSRNEQGEWSIGADGRVATEKGHGRIEIVPLRLPNCLRVEARLAS